MGMGMGMYKKIHTITRGNGTKVIACSQIRILHRREGA